MHLIGVKKKDNNKQKIKKIVVVYRIKKIINEKSSLQSCKHIRKPVPRFVNPGDKLIKIIMIIMKS
jgi:hypothetical protein